MSGGINITEAQLELIDKQGKDARDVLLFLIEKRMTKEKWSIRSLASEKGITKEKSAWWLNKIYEFVPNLKNHNKTATRQQQDSFENEPSNDEAPMDRNKTATRQQQDKTEKRQKKCSTSEQNVDNSDILGIAIEPNRDSKNKYAVKQSVCLSGLILQKPVKQIKHFISQILDCYYQTFGKRQTDRQSLDLINKRLEEGWSADDLCKVIKGYAINPFFMKKNATPPLTYIFRSENGMLVNKNKATTDQYQKQGGMAKPERIEQTYICQYYDENESEKSKRACASFPIDETQANRSMREFKEHVCIWHAAVRNKDTQFINLILNN